MFRVLFTLLFLLGFTQQIAFGFDIDRSKCKIAYKNLFLIAMVERHPKRAIGYPYLISFNNKNDVMALKPYLREYFLDNRTIDCKDERTCTIILDALVKKGYTNLDLGAFQINYRYYKYPLSDYFQIEKSLQRGCEILQSKLQYKKRDHIQSYQDIALYHSFNKKHLKKYSKYLAYSDKKLQMYIKDVSSSNSENDVEEIKVEKDADF